MQSVTISTEVVISNPAHDEVHSKQHYVIKFVSDLTHVGTPVSSTSKTDRHNITKILLKVALNTTTVDLAIIVFTFTCTLWEVC